MYVLSVVDLGAVAEQAGDIRRMMVDCVPTGYVRTPGVGCSERKPQVQRPRDPDTVQAKTG